MTLTFNPKSCLVRHTKEYKSYGFDKFKENVTKLINKKKRRRCGCLLMKRILENLVATILGRTPASENLIGIPLSFAKPKICEHHTIKMVLMLFLTPIYTVLQGENSIHFRNTWRMCSCGIFTGYNLIFYP